MSRNLIIIVVVIIVVIGGVILLAGQQGKKSATQAPTEAVQEQPAPTEVIQEEEVATEEAGMTGKASIEIKNFTFGPKTITVKKDTKVTFANQDSVSHTATSDDGSFDTGLLAKGESQSITFDEAGTYNYHCTPHPNMKATIIVQ